MAKFNKDKMIADGGQHTIINEKEVIILHQIKSAKVIYFVGVDDILVTERKGFPKVTKEDSELFKTYCKF